MGFWEVVVLRKKVFLPEEPFLQKWNKIFLVLSVFALSLDLLFFYEFEVDNQRKCLRLDLNLERVVFILSSVVGFCLTIRVIFQFRTGFYVSTSRVFDSRMLIKDSWKIAKRYLLSYFVIDILATIPLPQVAIFLIIPHMAGPRVLNTLNVLKFIVTFQLFPKMFRFYQLYKETLKSSHKHSRIAQLTLFLYICAGIVNGAFWYLFSIEREMHCWEGACGSLKGCSSSKLSCSGYFGNEADTTYLRLLDIACPADLQGRSPFDFGMFIDAHNSGILGSTSFWQKLLFSSWWGLQNLSTLGQNLKTSKHISEICFAVCSFIGGVVLFSFVIGIIQATMSSTMRAEKMKMKWQDVEHWMDTYALPPTLRKRIKRQQQYKWEETKGLDVENLLHNFPKQLRNDIKRHLFMNLILRVPMFEAMHDQLLDTVCDRLKPALYTEDNYIVREGEPVDEMLFIMRGKLQSLTTNGGTSGFFNSVYLKAGDFCGYELLTWALDSHRSVNFPISTRTIRTLTKVEAFALMADDMKFVASEFRRLHNWKHLQHTYRYYSLQWMTWAACFIQAAWRRYLKKKLDESRRREEDKLQDALAKTSGNSPSLGAIIYASRFAVNALRALRRMGTRETRLVERVPVPPMLLQKPEEPDFASKEQ